MDGKKRRDNLLNILLMETGPISGSDLAHRLGVSRQVIVQDIALIRAENNPIISTTKGYMLNHSVGRRVRKIFKVKHSNEDIEDELLTIVKYGGKVLSVIVNHPVYGTISTELIIETESEAREFANRVEGEGTTPLKELTHGEHAHCIEAESEVQLNEIQNALKEKNYLIPE